MPRYSDIVFAIMHADRDTNESLLGSTVAMLCDLAGGRYAA